MTRTLSRWLPLVAALLALAHAPAVAFGQSASDHWPGLNPSRLPTIYVQNGSGTETAGQLVELSADSLVLLVNGAERRFAFTEVARIQKRDSLKNGTIIGAVVGAAMGLVAGGISDCPGPDPGGNCAGFRAAAVVGSTLAYTGLGAGVDALIQGRTTLYRAPRPAPGRASFDRSGARAALRVGVSW